MSATVTWITLAVEDLFDYLVAPQVNAINTAALGKDADGRFGKVMADITSRIRNKIKRRSVVSATPNAIPPECKWIACYLIIEALQTSIPGLGLTQDQRTQCERAVAELNRISAGQEMVSTPDDPEESNATGGMTVLRQKEPVVYSYPTTPAS